MLAQLQRCRASASLALASSGSGAGSIRRGLVTGPHRKHRALPRDATANATITATTNATASATASTCKVHFSTTTNSTTTSSSSSSSSTVWLDLDDEFEQSLSKARLALLPPVVVPYKGPSQQVEHSILYYYMLDVLLYYIIFILYYIICRF
jgi:hypothetical protein